MSQSTYPNEHFARLSDGKSAGAEDAKVILGLTGIEIRRNDAAGLIVWPYETLNAVEPLRSHAIDALLTSTVSPGLSLFVPGPEFARALRKSAPHLTAKAERWRHARPWAVGGLALAALIAIIYAAGWSPLRTIATALPLSWRERLGDQAIASIAKDHNQCVAPEGLAALEQLSRRLTKVAGRDEPFKIEVYDWSLVNAFAVPGGKIVITRALIEQAKSSDEVAGVLAHEMGHGVELHPETGIIRAVGLSAAVELMMGGSGGTLANLGLILAQLGYTRSAEHEADLQALKLLKGAAISPKGLGDFFHRVEKTEGEDDTKEKSFKPFDLLRTHPPTAERERLVLSQPTYPSTPALDTTSWDELRRVCSSTRAREQNDGDD